MAMIRFVCRGCQQVLEAKKALAGKMAHCLLCGHVTTVPRSPQEGRVKVRAWRADKAARKQADAMAEAHRQRQQRDEDEARNRAVAIAEQREGQERAHYEAVLRGEAFDSDILVAMFHQDWIQVHKDTGLTPAQISEGAKAASLPIGAGAWYLSGNPWIGIIAAVGAALLSEPLASGYARLKFEEWRQKWLEIFSRCSEEQLAAFYGSLQARYPFVYRSLAGPGNLSLPGG